MEAYPLIPTPFFQDYIWGGRNLKSKLGKPLPDEGIWAESWEIVDHADHQSVVSNGRLAGMTLRQIAADHGQWLLGAHSSEFSSIPLLLKYLDCQRVLSVQVHPDDAYGQSMAQPDLGKTEAWYIISAEPDSVLYAGLKPDVSPDQLRQAIADGNVEATLHEIHPKSGDCVFIPAGTVHALGAGLLVAEIQQASNTTFRLFDWNRVGHDGEPRQLHVEQAIEVIDFASGPRDIQAPTATCEPGREQLVHCDKFVLDRIQSVESADLANDSKMHFLTTPTGGIQLSWQNNQDARQQLMLEKGESVVIPAAMPPICAELTIGATLLDMYLP